MGPYSNNYTMSYRFTLKTIQITLWCLNFRKYNWFKANRRFCRAIKPALPDLLNPLRPLCPKSKAVAASHRNQSFESDPNMCTALAYTVPEPRRRACEDQNSLAKSKYCGPSSGSYFLGVPKGSMIRLTCKQSGLLGSRTMALYSTARPTD